MGRLALGDRDPATLSAEVHLRDVQPDEVLAVDTRVLDEQRRLAGGDRLVETQLHPFPLDVGGQLRGAGCGGPVELEVDRVPFEIEGVHVEHRCGLRDDDPQGHPAGETVGVGVDLQVQVVVERPDRAREPVGAVILCHGPPT